MEKKLTEKDKKRQYYMRIIIISLLSYTYIHQFQIKIINILNL